MSLPTAPVTAPEVVARPRSARRRFGSWLHQRPRLQVRALLAGPVGWLLIAYLGSLLILLLNAFFAKDPFTGRVEPFTWSLDAFRTLVSNPVYGTIALRTA